MEHLTRTNIFLYGLSAGILMIGSASVTVAAEGTWTTRTALSAPTLGHHAAAVENRIYVIGGGGVPTAASRSHGIVSIYDPATDSWTRGSDMPTARAFFATAVVDGKIYCIGGSANRRINDPGLAVVEVYDPATDSWARMADMPAPRADLTASAVNGKIYAIGGTRHVGVDALPVVEKFDPATNIWTRMADMPTPRLHLTSAVVEDNIYVIGGSPEWPVPLAATEAYDPATDSWARMADMPTERTGLWAAALNSKIYAMGGRGWDGTALGTVEEFDPATDSWAAMADMPTPRYLFAVEAAAGKVYAIGGRSTENTGFTTVEEFTPPILTN